MKVLVVGSGGREHALAWKISRSKRVDKIFITPGNAGTAEFGTNLPIDAADIDGLLNFAVNNHVELTVVGPEVPLVEGIVDRFEGAGLRIFGPSKKAAQLEGSKVYSKNFMAKYDIPTAKYEVFTSAGDAVRYIEKNDCPLVIKAEGLAAGKGVIVAGTREEAVKSVNSILVKDKFGDAGKRIVIEEFLEGEEATVLAFVDGETVIPMLPSQDHKQAYDNDRGPNTGGMGAYAPAPVVDDKLMEKIYHKIIVPTVEGLKSEGIVYSGILYCGLMIKDGEPVVLEYNVRFGDPETQVILPLLETDLVEVMEAVIEKKLHEIEIKWKEKNALCVVMASGGYPLSYQKGKKIEGINKAEKLKGIKVFQAGTSRQNKKLLTAGGRVLAVTAVEMDFKFAINRAYEAVSKINFEDAHYRKDIGKRA